MPQFFINRPIFAWVVSIIIMVVGAVAITQMPIEQYPKVAPTQISIDVTYPGATAQDLEETVMQVIEREMNSAKGLAYMETVSNANGRGSITLSFEAGRDADMAQVDVQNLLARATPRLPAAVTQQGVMVRQARSNFLMMLAFTSNDPNFTAEDINDYVARNIVDELSRLKGVGQAMQFGSGRAMRIWIKPDVLKGYGLTTQDVYNALSTQNAQISAGTVGDTPIVEGQETFAAVVVHGLLTSEEEFENIVLRANIGGSAVKLGDVARVEYGSEMYSFAAKYNGKESSAIGIQQSSDGNALATAKLIKAKMVELSKNFPAALEYTVGYDSTKFISTSIEKVVHTLFEAVLLVFIVIFIFLQNVRYTVIPTIVVPIALLGGFTALYAFGMSINVLSMFAMVLVIGIVVDDAIIVVENVERIMSEEKLPPLQAARKAMTQITGAIIGVTVVLISVFIPLAFFQGSTGNIYRQFAATMTSTIFFSAFMALSLTPALCATMLRAVDHSHDGEKKGFFGWFNRGFAKTTKGYQGLMARVLKRSKTMMVAYLAIIAAIGVLWKQMPTSFLPEEDQGFVLMMAIGMPGSSAERMDAVVDKFELYLHGRPDVLKGMGLKPDEIESIDSQSHPLECQKLTNYVALNRESFDGLLRPEQWSDCSYIYTMLKGYEEVDSVVSVRGFSFMGQGQNTAFAFVTLKDWKERTRPDQKASELSKRIGAGLAGIRDAMVMSLSPPAIMELGFAEGFVYRLQDRGGHGHDALVQARAMLLGMTVKDEKASKILAGVRQDDLPDTPQILLDIDREKAFTQGVDMSAINSALAIGLGSAYVNDFVVGGRTQRVIIQNDAKSRMQEDQIMELNVRNNQGQMVPLKAFATTKPMSGPVQTIRYNGYPTLKVAGGAMPGFSTGDAMAMMEELSARLPEGFTYEWSGLSREEKIAGAQAYIVYAFAILAVFLCLAAVYESWSIPFSVMMVVPLGVIGVVLATILRGMGNDIYFQIGFITIIGLSAKNAILIIEFAKDLQAAGKSLFDAALEAAHLRFRPILMTSLAFTLGVLPLFIATGASSASQRAIGTGVVGGMITGTILAIIFVPVFFVVVRSIFKSKPHTEEEHGELNMQEQSDKQGGVA